MSSFGLNSQIAQINYATNTHKNTLRGMHYQQPPAAETKYISCIAGSIFDVVVDLRKGSETFLQWHGVELTATKPSLLVLPPGFAHGYLTLDANSHLIYGHSACYQPDLEAALRFDDPRLSIRWPEKAQVISDRDRHHRLISDAFEGVSL